MSECHISANGNIPDALPDIKHTYEPMQNNSMLDTKKPLQG